MADPKAGAAGAKKKKLIKGRHKSAIKRHRQSLKRASQNSFIFSRLKSTIKEVIKLAKNKDKSGASEKLRLANSLLDKAAQKGKVHWKYAARHTSRLAAMVGRL